MRAFFLKNYLKKRDILMASILKKSSRQHSLTNLQSGRMTTKVFFIV